MRGAGIRIEVEGTSAGRLYRLPAMGLPPAELDLTGEERAVLVGALRALRRDFPYEEPLRLAIANIIGAASAGAEDPESWNSEQAASLAAVTSRRDDAIAGRVATLEGAVSRRKRVRFVYYAISRDETSEREVDPYELSLIDGTWYVTGWDNARDDVRQFRLSRIDGRVSFATKRDSRDFEVREEFADRYSGRYAGSRAPWQLGRPEKTARVRVSEDAFATAHRFYGFALSLDRDEVGGGVLTTRYSGERQLAGWILSLGEEARTLSPESLVGRVRHGVERIAAAHGDPATEEKA